MTTPHWHLLLWAGIWCCTCLVLLFISHHYLNKARFHISEKTLRRLRVVVTIFIMIGAAVIALDIVQVVEISPVIIALYTFAIPVIIGGCLSPLIPGIMLMIFRRYEVGDHVYIGALAAPLAHGKIVGINLQSTFFTNSYGEQNLSNAVIQGQTVTKTTAPEPQSVTGLDDIPEGRPGTLNQAAEQGETNNV